MIVVRRAFTGCEGVHRWHGIGKENVENKTLMNLF